MMNVKLSRFALGLYILWLVAVVLFVVYRFTPVPVLPGVEEGLVLGTAVFFVIGVGQLGKEAYSRLRSV